VPENNMFGADGLANIIVTKVNVFGALMPDVVFNMIESRCRVCEERD